MRKIVISSMVICFMMVYSVFPISIAEARISDEYKSKHPEEAFLKTMKQHYRDCETKDHLEDFLCLALQASLEHYDIARIPAIDSVAIFPPNESYTFKGGIIKGLSDNLTEKASYKVVDSAKVLEELIDRNMLTEYSSFRNELFSFDFINKPMLSKFGKTFNVNYILIPRIYEYVLVQAEGGVVAVSKWAVELNLFSVKDATLEWTLVNVIKSVDLQMTQAEQLGNYAGFAIIAAIFGGSASSPLGASRRRLKERKERLDPDYKQFSTFFTDIILTLGKYDLTEKVGIPKKECEYKTWLRTGTFPRMQKSLY